jgi:hypothetical protein
MKRWLAVVFLLLIAFYLATTGVDRCTDQPSDQGQVCHILCSDGCATAPVPEAPEPPAPDALPRPVYQIAVIKRVASLDLEPEKAPPRA